ncbi:hypothetical protein ACI2VT_16415 [Ralstonia nicotianae]
MPTNAASDVCPMAGQAVRSAAYDAHYNRIACALETHNVERAGTYLLEAREQLTTAEAGRLERELTDDYYEFT